MRNLDLLDETGKVTSHLDLDSLLKEIETSRSQSLVVREPEVIKTEPKLEVKEAGVLSQIANFEIMDLPVGAVVGGGAIAVLATELVDGLLVKQTIQTRGAIKVAAAVGTVMFGKKLLGSKLTMWAAGFMLFDGLRDIVPLDLYVKKAANMITGTVTTKGLAQRANRNESPIVMQANTVADDYYDRTRRGG